MVCFLRVVTSSANHRTVSMRFWRAGESGLVNVKVQTTSQGPPLNIGTRCVRRWLGRTEDRHADLGNLRRRCAAAASSGSGFFRRGRLFMPRRGRVFRRRGVVFLGVLAGAMSFLHREWVYLRSTLIF